MLYSASSALWILIKHAPKYCVVVVLKTLGVGVFYICINKHRRMHVTRLGMLGIKSFTKLICLLSYDTV
jgi:hypothetical protein